MPASESEAGRGGGSANGHELQESRSGSLARGWQSGDGWEPGEDPSVNLRLEPTKKKRRDPWGDATRGGLVIKNCQESA